MNDQFPATSQTPLMTVPAVIQWLSMEAEDVRAEAKAEKRQAISDMLIAQALRIDILIEKLTGTAMRALDGDTSAGKSINEGRQ